MAFNNNVKKGEIIRTRTCTNPMPQYDGKKCYGEPIQNRPCYLRKCVEISVKNEAENSNFTTDSQIKTSGEISVKNENLISNFTIDSKTEISGKENHILVRLFSIYLII